MRNGCVSCKRHDNGADFIIKEELQVCLCGLYSAKIEIKESFQIGTLRLQQAKNFKGWNSWFPCPDELLIVVLGSFSLICIIANEDLHRVLKGRNRQKDLHNDL